MATMLHWLAGAKTADTSNDTNACIDPPETPAPVFAVKAFRHALFGTPPTAQRPQPRRHSTTENRPRNVESPKPTRPRMDRPKSANDANALLPPPASPTKGILMTPGTAAAKKKNVTFGDAVVDNQEKRPMKSGLPDDCPGKFPSPWSKAADGEREGPAEKGRGRNKLTEALEHARDESRQRRGSVEDDENGRSRPQIPADENDCCEYWRREYEVYRTNTQREVKKLVKKYKAAKDYAQSKDDEASDLRLHLQEADAKADALEEAVNILTAQIKEMEVKYSSQPQPQAQPEPETLVPATRHTKERERPRDLQALLERRGSRDRTVSSTTVRTTENDQLQRPSEPRQVSSRRTLDREKPVQRPSQPPNKDEKPGAEDREHQARSEEALATTREPTRPTATVRTPAGIAARWAAVKDAPQRPSEPTPAASKQETETAEPRRNHPASVSTATSERAIAPTRTLAAKQPSTGEPIGIQAPPGDLFLPSDPAIYASSPPTKSLPQPQQQSATAQPTKALPKQPAATTTTTQPTKPLPPKPTVEDASNSSPPPPAPPPHSHRPPPPKRQDSGSGGTLLKALSPNARSGGAAPSGEGLGAGEGPRLGRDGKPIDAARLEAAKARIRGRGREVS